MRTWKKLCSLLMAVLVLCSLTGCKEEREIPELIEPLADNRSFRPVQRGDVGELKVDIGVVVPKEYSHYYKTATTLRSIYFDVGDYVQAGDILAEIDLEAMKERRQELTLERDLLDAKCAMQAALEPLQREIQDYEKKNQDIIKDGKMMEEFKSRVGAENENQRFTREEYAFRIQTIDKELAEIDKEIADGTLCARQAGYVTYVKDMSKTSDVEGYEAVVVIGDFDDLLIELPTETSQSNKYQKFEHKFAYVDGREIPMEEIEYSVPEQVYARAIKKYPTIRYRLLESAPLSMGQNIALGFMLNRQSDVLLVGNDSVYADEEGNYVYVGDAEGNLERRSVSVGAADDFNKEVLSGLEEGEPVFCVQSTVVPTNYEEYTIERGTYSLEEDASGFKRGDKNGVGYFSSVSGRVVELIVSSGNSVKKGDLLMVLDAEGGVTKGAELEMNLKHLALNYNRDQKAIDKEIYEIRKGYNAQISAITTDWDGLPRSERDTINNNEVIADRQTQVLIRKKEINKRQYEYDVFRCQQEINRRRSEVDPDGKIRIVAKEDGVVSKVYAALGQEIKVYGNKALLLTCEAQADDRIDIYPSRHAEWVGIGTSCRIILDAGKEKLDAQLINRTTRDRTYVFTEGDEIIASGCNPGENYRDTVTAKIDPEYLEKTGFFYGTVKVESLRLTDMITIPGSYIYYEDSTSKDKTYGFVFKRVGGEIVKQYVRKATDYGFGDDYNAVIFSGLEVGDVIVKDKTK